MKESESTWIRGRHARPPTGIHHQSQQSASAHFTSVCHGNPRCQDTKRLGNEALACLAQMCASFLTSYLGPASLYARYCSTYRHAPGH